jgi:hypothetical protein
MNTLHHREQAIRRQALDLGGSLLKHGKGVLGFGGANEKCEKSLQSLITTDKFADGYHEFIDPLIGLPHAFVGLPQALIRFLHARFELLPN